MPVHVKSYHPYTIDLEGGSVRLKLARMTETQFAAFNAVFQAHSKGRGQPAEEAPLEEQVAYLQRNAAWVAEMFHTYVRLVEGDLIHTREDDSTEVITDGARFAELYMAEASGVLAELWLANALTDAQKKTSRSARDSDTGSSTAPSPAAPGARPETAATPVDSSGSVRVEDATAPSNDASSGTTDPSSSAPVLSEV